MGRLESPDWSARPTTVPYAKFGDPQSLNLYAYVRNNPLNLRDLDGHCNTSVFPIDCGGFDQFGPFNKVPQCICQNSTPQIPFTGGLSGDAGAGGSWGTPDATDLSHTVQRVHQSTGGTAVVLGPAALSPSLTDSPLSSTLQSVETPYGPAFQGPGAAEISALEDATAGATLYRAGWTGVQNTVGAQFWSLSNPALTENIAEINGMPGIVGSRDSVRFIMGGRLLPGAAAITRIAPGVIGGGAGGNCCFSSSLNRLCPLRHARTLICC